MRHVGRLGMGILPAYRGQGLGRRLLREVLSRMFARGLLRVELEVFASNLPAIKLYEREGFVTEGRKRRARIWAASRTTSWLWNPMAGMVVRYQEPTGGDDLPPRGTVS